MVRNGANGAGNGAAAEGLTVHDARDIARRVENVTVTVETVSENVDKISSKMPDGWSTCELTAIPNHRARSMFDEAIALVAELPAGVALVRKFANRDVADTQVKGITGRARKRKMRICSRVEGDTIYLWRKA